MSLEPLGPYLRVTTQNPVYDSRLWVPKREPLGLLATVQAIGTQCHESWLVGDTVLVSMRLGIQVGEELLVPENGILARLTS